MWQNYTLWGAGAGLSYSFGDPALNTGMPWVLNLSVTLQWWAYDAPNPIIDPDVIQTQTDTILSALLAIPLDARTSFIVSGGWFNRAASLPNYSFSNASVLIGASWRF